MDRISAAHAQYETEQGFPSPEYESLYAEGLVRYIAQRKAYHLLNPEDGDLDTLVYEGSHLSYFIQQAPDDLLEAASALLRAIEKVATELARDDAADASDEEIVNAL